jgi:hypothetical protein
MSGWADEWVIEFYGETVEDSDEAGCIGWRN